MADPVLLRKIEHWRTTLARNLAMRNPNLGQRGLNSAVQGAIDGIIFLRMCEHRGIEPDGRLRKLLQEPDVYANLIHLFQKANERFKLSLFRIQTGKERSETPDTATTPLILDDKPLKDILHGLYYPESPHEFSLLSCDTFGQVYEQFLGKAIRLTDGRRAVVEDKPETRKAGGIYYTPAYIVDYIVEQTVGKLLGEPAASAAGLTPKQAAPLRILDPACGSGSFLLGAYQLLLDWHRDYYLQGGTKKYTRELYQGTDGVWRLTLAEKKRILMANLYGVDIDPCAVELTKLSLLFKMLDGESKPIRQARMQRLPEQMLPDLSLNIQCGNALVGPDFFDGWRMELFGNEKVSRINALDWEKAFPWLPAAGGFDVVLGNPPYIDSEWMTVHLPETREYCVSRYEAASGNWDIFCVFVEKALRLAKPKGLVSMIVPNKLASANYAAGCRRVMAANSRLTRVRDYSQVRVFPIAIYPIVFVASKEEQPDSFCRTVLYERMSPSGVRPIECEEVNELDYFRHFGQPERSWQLFGSIESSSPAEKMRAGCPTLESMATVLGAATVSEAYRIADLISEFKPDGEINPGFKVVNSGTIDRYCMLWGKKPLRYLGSTYNQPFVEADAALKLPPVRRRQAESRKIIIAGMTLRLESVLDLEGSTLAAKSTTLVLADLDLKYLLGILNSRAVAHWYNTVYGGNRLAGGYLRIGPPQVRNIPIPVADLSKSTDKQRHDRLVQLIDEMLSLHKQLAATQTPQDQTILKRAIKTTDRRIDHLVYELYGLTDAEIRIVEAAALGGDA